MSEAINLLRDLEWSGRSGMEGEDDCCPECGNCRDEVERNRDSEFASSDDWGHEPVCRLARLVHGPVSVDQWQKIAAAKALSDKRQHEWSMKSKADQHAAMLDQERAMCEWQNEEMRRYVRERGINNIVQDEISGRPR